MLLLLPVCVSLILFPVFCENEDIDECRFFLSVLAITIQKQTEILRDKTSRGVPCDSKSPQNCIEFRARSKLLRYRGDNCTKIALKSQPVYTCDFEVATSVRQKLH